MADLTEEQIQAWRKLLRDADEAEAALDEARAKCEPVARRALLRSIARVQRRGATLCAVAHWPATLDALDEARAEIAAIVRAYDAAFPPPSITTGEPAFDRVRELADRARRWEDRAHLASQALDAARTENARLRARVNRLRQQVWDGRFLLGCECDDPACNACGGPPEEA